METILDVFGFPSAYQPAPFYGRIEGDRDTDGKLLNTFRPDAPINRAEVSKIIALAREVVKKG